MGKNDSIANAVGKGPILTLTVDGQDYTLAPLKMEDLADAELEAKKRRRAEVLATIKQAGTLLTADQRLEMIRELSVESDSWVDFLSTPSGAEYILVKRLMIAHPSMSKKKARSLITVEAISQIEAEMSQLVGLDVFLGKAEDEDEGEGGVSPPASE